MTPRQAITPEWAARLTQGPISLGYDVATSEKGTSNPSAVTVMQREGRICIARLVVSWKTREPGVARQVLSAILDDIQHAGFKARRLCIDASSEKFFAADMRTFLRARVAVELVAGGQKLDFRGESLDAKTLLGNMYASALEDGLIFLPAGEWIEFDHRLVKRESGRFVTDLGPGGEHGDTFDSGKLSYWGLQSGGTVQAHAAQVGSGVSGAQSLINRPGLIGPLRGGRTLGRDAARKINT
jgi:hypothetical protein